MAVQIASPSVIPFAPIPTVVVNDDLVIPMEDGSSLVSSKSHPGNWWHVVNGQCGCPRFAGVQNLFAGVGWCRHTVAATVAMERDRRTAVPVESTVLGESDVCVDCGEPQEVGVRCRECSERLWEPDGCDLHRAAQDFDMERFEAMDLDDVPF